MVEEATRLMIVGNKKEEVTRVPVILFKTYLHMTERLLARLHPLRVGSTTYRWAGRPAFNTHVIEGD